MSSAAVCCTALANRRSNATAVSGGAGRFVQKGRGYRATLCNGEVILENDEHTGTRAGQVLRS